MITIEDVKNYLGSLGEDPKFAGLIPLQGYWSNYTRAEMEALVDEYLASDDAYHYRNDFECHFPYLK